MEPTPPIPSPRTAKKPLAQQNEQDLQVFLKRARWPNGFVCPKCGWTHTRAWADGKGRRVRHPKPGAAHRYKQDWNTKKGRIICQKCARQTSPTAGTELDRARLPLSTIHDAALVYLRAVDGMSEEELACLVKGPRGRISTRTARRLIQKFHKGMAPRSEDRLGGTVQIDEGVLLLGTNNRKKCPEVYIIIAAQKSGSASRIGLKIADVPFDIVMAASAVELIRDAATVETRRMDVYGMRLKNKCIWSPGAKGKQAPLGEDLLPRCATVFDHVQQILKRKYRSAIKPDNLQGYLDEIAFRWNHKDNLEPAALKLMARLVCPPGPIELSDEYDAMP